MAQATLPSPIGLVLIDGDARHVRAIHILAPGIDAPPLDGDPDAPVREALEQLAGYFAGRMQTFDLPLAPLASERGNALRAAIMAIGYGDQLSYGALARIAASGPRAIGQACSRTHSRSSSPATA
jgi:methylated-DNA-[protein]-cysteine S-methyltransferase